MKEYSLNVLKCTAVEIPQLWKERIEKFIFIGKWEFDRGLGDGDRHRLRVKFLRSFSKQVSATVWGIPPEQPDTFVFHQDRIWDTEVLGWKCGVVNCLVISDEESNVASIATRAYTSWARKNNYDLISSRIPAGRIAEIQALEDAGFRSIEVYIDLERDLDVHPPQEIDLVCEVASPDDAEAIGDLAGRTFSSDRLHTDPRVPDEKADSFKREWAVNSCRGYADHVLFVRRSGTYAGFVTIRLKEQGKGVPVGVIDLIGVDKIYQGQGVGRALVEMSCKWVNEQGVQRVSVGTQGGNVLSLSLYQNSQFRIVQSSIGLHWVRSKQETLT